MTTIEKLPELWRARAARKRECGLVNEAELDEIHAAELDSAIEAATALQSSGGEVVVAYRNELGALVRELRGSRSIHVDCKVAADSIESAMDAADDELETTTLPERLLEALKFACAELAGLPHSLGYEFTHLPKIDAAIAEAAQALQAPEGGECVVNGYLPRSLAVELKFTGSIPAWMTERPLVPCYVSPVPAAPSPSAALQAGENG